MAVSAVDFFISTASSEYIMQTSQLCYADIQDSFNQDWLINLYAIFFCTNPNSILEN